VVTRNKIISIFILVIFCILVFPTAILACTYESTIVSNHLELRITSDINNIQMIQLMHVNNAPSAPYTITNLYGPSSYPWVQYLDTHQTYSGYSMVIQNRRQTADGAYWVNWIDSTHYTSIPAGNYGLNFTGVMNYNNISVEYGTISDGGVVGGTGEPWTFCTRTGEIGSSTATPTATANATATSTATPIPTTTPIITPTSTSTPMGVPNLKQYTGGWENNIYDHTVKTIKDWGCALTSAVMVLRYHGHDVWPNTLNDWLNSQKDGYIRNGLINWLAVSRYTKIHDSVLSPTLMYKRLLPTNINLNEEINNLRPAILKEDGHFIVATGKTLGSYFINDPGYTSRNTLESYMNNFLAINSYTPTHSDLSYMMFVVDKNINLELFDLEGNIIETQKFVEDPITDIDDLTSKSGEPLSILIFEKPTSGRYMLKVSGVSGDYHLESYLYDRDGSVTYNIFFGILFGDDFDTYQINYSSESQTYLTLDEIINNLDSAYQNGLVKNKGVYQSIKMHLKIYSRIESETYMKLVIKQIKSLTPKLIDPSYSLILQQNLESLISE